MVKRDRHWLIGFIGFALCHPPPSRGAIWGIMVCIIFSWYIGTPGMHRGKSDVVNNFFLLWAGPGFPFSDRVLGHMDVLTATYLESPTRRTVKPYRTLEFFTFFLFHHQNWSELEYHLLLLRHHLRRVKFVSDASDWMHYDEIDYGSSSDCDWGVPAVVLELLFELWGENRLVVVICNQIIVFRSNFGSSLFSFDSVIGDLICWFKCHLLAG